jgi:hypothetical protein
MQLAVLVVIPQLVRQYLSHPLVAVAVLELMAVILPPAVRAAEVVVELRVLRGQQVTHHPYHQAKAILAEALQVLLVQVVVAQALLDKTTHQQV